MTLVVFFEYGVSSTFNKNCLSSHLFFILKLRNHRFLQKIFSLFFLLAEEKSNQIPDIFLISLCYTTGEQESSKRQWNSQSSAESRFALFSPTSRTTSTASLTTQELRSGWEQRCSGGRNQSKSTSTPSPA